MTRVSILHWNRPQECLATVRSLLAQGVALSLTVVDNHSAGRAIATLEQGLPEGVELIKLGQNVGWGPAHNVVLKRWLEQETSDYCIVSAHDALPQGRCLAKLLAAMERHRDWGMACPEYGKPELPRYSALRGVRLIKADLRAPNTMEEVEFCHGTLAVFRRDCLRQIGLFDARYFAYGDETEIGLRARAHGWKVGLVWGSVVLNPGTWSGGPVIAYLSARNSLLIARSVNGRAGLMGRLAVVILALVREKIRGSGFDSNASPAARWLGIKDYFRGRTGGPPAELAVMRQNFERERAKL